MSMDWEEPVKKRLTELMKLPEDWDSYGASRVDPKIGRAAYQLLLGIMEPGVPRPLIVPTSDGGIQLEWGEQYGLSVEIDIDKPYHCYINIEVSRPGNMEAWSGPAAVVLTKLLGYLKPPEKCDCEKKP